MSNWTIFDELTYRFTLAWCHRIDRKIKRLGIITPDEVKKGINETLKDQDTKLLSKAFAAKVKMKQSVSITIDILDEWEKPLVTDVDVEGDEVSDDIHVGDLISLVN